MEEFDWRNYLVSCLIDNQGFGLVRGQVQCAARAGGGEGYNGDGGGGGHGGGGGGGAGTLVAAEARGPVERTRLRCLEPAGGTLRASGGG